MSEIRITRASPDELKHFGIKGQKWGVRRYQNADGTLTDEGKIHYGTGKEQDKFVKDLHTSAVYRSARDKTSIKAVERLENSPQIAAAVANTKKSALAYKAARDEADRYEDDWYRRKDSKMYDKYTRKLAEIQAEKYDHSKSEEDIKIRLDLIRNDDLDQGESFRLYLNDHPLVKKSYEVAQERAIQTWKDYKAACQDYSNQWLGIHANESIWSRTLRDGTAYSYTTSDRMTAIIQRVGMTKLDSYYNPI